MGVSPQQAPQRAGMRDHGFHELRVQNVVRETADASSFVLDIPDDLRDAYAYEAGQFLTFRARIDGQTYLRSYSMSSSPAIDADMQVTVKRVPAGVVSNWMIDTLEPGDVAEATCPAGVFCLGPDDRDIVAFSAGSGITPVFSIVKEALAKTSRHVRLLYANRDRDAVIFAAELDELLERHLDRLDVVHHLDVEQGFVDAADVSTFTRVAADAEYYICGPAPFMDIVEAALLHDGVEADRIHIERFTPLEPPAAPPAPAAASVTRVTIELDGRTDTVDYRPGTTILQTARQMGMSPPFSCESGSCATCMAKIVEGAATMHVNNALTDEEVDEGWILTCQAVPTTPSVHVIYETS